MDDIDITRGKIYPDYHKHVDDAMIVVYIIYMSKGFNIPDYIHIIDMGISSLTIYVRLCRSDTFLSIINIT